MLYCFLAYAFVASEKHALVGLLHEDNFIKFY